VRKYLLLEFDHIFGDELPDIRRALGIHAISENDIDPNVVPSLVLNGMSSALCREILARRRSHFDDLKPSVEGSPFVEMGRKK